MSRQRSGLPSNAAVAAMGLAHAAAALRVHVAVARVAERACMRLHSMVKVPLWQGSSSPPVPSQGALGGSGRRVLPGGEASPLASSHCLGCLS